MKLIIDIPEELYKGIECRNPELETEYVCYELMKAVDKGTPLDDVKAEIKGWYWQADKQALAKDPCVIDAMIDLFIRTIDNIGKESEDT